MQIPTPPQPKVIESVSPTLFEALRACKAKALWMKFGPRQIVPETPSALLGTSFHKVMEVAARRQLPANEFEAVPAARKVFDEEAKLGFSRAHALLRAKYSSKEHLPNYYLQRERAAIAAKRICLAIPTQPTASPNVGAVTSVAPEQSFSSTDGQLTGKIDWLKAAEQEIVDYKSGIAPQGDGVLISDRERRQLMFYAYLASQRGHVIRKGTIVRGNGKSCSIQIQS
jgi:hypothetical protein